MDKTYTIPAQARIAIGIAMITHRRTMEGYRADDEKAGDANGVAYWQKQLDDLEEGFRALDMSELAS